MTGNWGTFAGESGLAMNAAVRLAKNVQLNGGVAYGLNEDIAGGRVGVRVGWYGADRSSPGRWAAGKFRLWHEADFGGLGAWLRFLTVNPTPTERKVSNL
jgi:hypothetical protein